MNAFVKDISERKVIAILRNIAPERAAETAQALYQAGIRCCEVTFDAKDPSRDGEIVGTISQIVKHMEGKMLVGAGTVLNTNQVRQVLDTGANLIISPHFNPAVIQETKRLGGISCPGAFTPTEVLTAYECGADMVKLFPASVAGTAYIKALRAPLGQVPLVAVGGVDETNIGEFLDVGCIAVGVGGNLVKKSFIDAGDFAALEQHARKFVLAAGL